MIQRFIGVSLGAIVTYVMLLATNIGAGEEASKYGLAVIVGAIVSFAWPWVAALLLARRVKARRDEQISKEVDKRMSGE